MAVTEDSPPSPPGAIAIGKRRISIELKSFFRDWNSAIWNFLLPVILMIIFGSVFGNVPIGEGFDISFAQYFVAGMIASGIIYTSFQNLGIAIPIERENGTLKRLSGTPMPKVSYFIGKTATVFVIYTVQVILLIAVGVLLYDVRLPDAGQWITFVWVSALGLTCWTLLGLAFSGVPKTSKGAAALVSPIVLVLQFTSGVFFIFSQLPEWMQSLAALFPLKWLAQGMRSVFLPDEAQVLEANESWELGLVALALGAWCLIGLALALAFFKWQPDDN